MSTPERDWIFRALLAQSGLNPASHDLTELHEAWEKLSGLMDRLDAGDAHGEVALSQFDPTREL